jgi:hypothetical protein
MLPKHSILQWYAWIKPNCKCELQVPVLLPCWRIRVLTFMFVQVSFSPRPTFSTCTLCRHQHVPSSVENALTHLLQLEPFVFMRDAANQVAVDKRFCKKMSTIYNCKTMVSLPMLCLEKLNLWLAFPIYLQSWPIALLTSYMHQTASQVTRIRALEASLGHNQRPCGHKHPILHLLCQRITLAIKQCHFSPTVHPKPRASWALNSLLLSQMYSIHSHRSILAKFSTLAQCLMQAKRCWVWTSSKTLGLRTYHHLMQRGTIMVSIGNYAYNKYLTHIPLM